ncbi:hypothetical protein WI70_28695 [Burkholderia cepacia]|nr:hypothetical protein WI47_10645 [Burkholderia cepacia]KVC11994.1 hypothetical protein WI70_28695 [Burkholderia cepacia]
MVIVRELQRAKEQPARDRAAEHGAAAMSSPSLSHGMAIAGIAFMLKRRSGLRKPRIAIAF